MKRMLTLIALCLSITTYGQKVKLELKLQKDSMYYLNTTANMVIHQTINGSQQNVTTTITALVSHKVKTIHDTVYELETRYKTMAMHMEVAGRVIDFDSEGKGEKNIFSTLLQGMINRPFLIDMTKQGKILNVRNIDSLYSHLFDGLGNIDEEKKTQLKAQMQQSFSEKTIRGNYQDAFVVFPKLAIALNTPWYTTNTIDAAAVSAKTKMTYMINSSTNDDYLISGTGIVLSDKSPVVYKQSNGIPMRFVNITGNAVAKVKINKSTGWIIESNTTKTIKGTIEIKDTPKTPGGMTFPMDLKVEIIAKNLQL